MQLRSPYIEVIRSHHTQSTECKHRFWRHLNEPHAYFYLSVEAST